MFYFPCSYVAVVFAVVVCFLLHP